MNCSDYKQWFSPYVDGLLDLQKQAELKQHLSACLSCKGEFGSLQGMLRSLRSLEQPASPDLLPGIHKKLAQAPWYQQVFHLFFAPWPKSLPFHSLALATTALLVIVVVGLPRFHARTPAPATSFDKMLAFGRVGEEVRHDKLEPNFALSQSKPVAQESQVNRERRLGYKQNQLLSKETKDDAFWNFSGAPNVPNRAVKELEQGEKKSKGGTINTTLAGAVVASSPAPANTSLEPGRADEDISKPESGEVLNVKWHVSDFKKASASVIEWVSANGGLVASSDESRISVRLPAASVPGFLQKFSSEVPGKLPPKDSAWVLISLELSRE